MVVKRKQRYPGWFLGAAILAALLNAGQGVAGPIEAETHESELIQPHPDRLVLVEPGPVIPSVLYADGSIVELETEAVWRFINNGEIPGVTIDDLREVIQTMRQAFDGSEETWTLSHDSTRDGLDVQWNIIGDLPAGAAPGLETIAEYVEGVFSDPVTVQINIQMYDMGPSVLGSTQCLYTWATWSTTRSGLINGMDSDDVIHDYLPAGVLPVRYSGSSSTVTYEDRCYFTWANYKATIGTIGDPVASIALNTRFNWDYDPSNGVGGRMCFQSVVAHELGHALGFVSRAEEFYEPNYDVAALDIFRFQRTDGSGDYNPDSYGEFQIRPRTVDYNTPNDDVNSDLITVEYPMEDGDPWQASHFKDLNPSIGCMDPTQAYGETFYPNFYMQSDIDMLDAIGWDHPSTPAPKLPSPPHHEFKNRYISLDPNNGDASVAFRVEMTSGPGTTGILGWAGAPDDHDVSRIVAEPYYTAAWPEAFHIGDCHIVPVAVYEVRAIVEGADPGNPNAFSPPYEVATIAEPTPKKWADCVGAFLFQWWGPNGVVNMDDVMAAVQAFKVEPEAPHWTWVDVDDEVPNEVINFTDIMRIIQGFQGQDYPFRNPDECS